MSSSSYSASGSAARRKNVAIGTHRDLPIVACPRCQKQLYSNVCKKGPNAGRRFFKCIRLEYTDQACKFFKFEDEYEEWLIAQGLLQPTTVVVEDYQDPRTTNLLALKDSDDQVPHAVGSLRADTANINATLRQNNILLSRILLIACISSLLSLITLLLLCSK